MHRTSCSLTYSPSKTRINQEQSVKVQIYFYLSAIKFPRDTRVKLSCKLLSTLLIFLQQSTRQEEYSLVPYFSSIQNKRNYTQESGFLNKGRLDLLDSAPCVCVFLLTVILLTVLLLYYTEKLEMRRNAYAKVSRR